ncbi:MAG: D-alanyl-D-alanine carboxypeptidase/D-alanyl-D-alanine-endopeptidase [Phycisphaeraceae bacterium]
MGQRRRMGFSQWLGGVLALLLTASAAFADVESEMRRLIHAANLGKTRVAVMATDLTTGQPLARIGADQPMRPASNMKLITTAAALDILGSDFVFRTELALVEPAEPGQHPDLLVRGGGDPAFGDPRLLEEFGEGIEDLEDLLDQWADAVSSTGRTRFARLVVDDRVFDRQLVHDAWPKDQLINWWCAPVAGINIHQNRFNVLPIPTDPGQPPQVELFPHASYLAPGEARRVNWPATGNRAVTGNRDAFWVSREPGSPGLVYHGTVKNQAYAPLEIAMYDPPMLFAHMLAARLGERGIEVGEVVRVERDEMFDDARLLHVVRTSLPLVMLRTNRDSQNMFAEALLKRMGRVYTGMAGSWSNGPSAIRQFLRSRLGPASAAVRISDGSGMSRDNRVTARLMVELLESIHHDPALEKARLFRDSLAYVGKTADGERVDAGTLERGHRLRRLQPGSWVFAKTGYIRGVSALSGYLQVPGESGQPPRTIAFSVLFNDFKPPIYNSHMKKLTDSLVYVLEKAARPAKSETRG